MHFLCALAVCLIATMLSRRAAQPETPYGITQGPRSVVERPGQLHRHYAQARRLPGKVIPRNGVEAGKVLAKETSIPRKQPVCVYLGVRCNQEIRKYTCAVPPPRRRYSSENAPPESQYLGRWK